MDRRKVIQTANRTRSVLYIERFAYQCDHCSTKFNWDANCRTPAKYHPGKPVPTFCSPGCAAAWKKQQNRAQ